MDWMDLSQNITPPRAPCGAKKVPALTMSCLKFLKENPSGLKKTDQSELFAMDSLAQTCELGGRREITVYFLYGLTTYNNKI